MSRRRGATTITRTWWIALKPCGTSALLVRGSSLESVGLLPMFRSRGTALRYVEGDESAVIEAAGVPEPRP